MVLQRAFFAAGTGLVFLLTLGAAAAQTADEGRLDHFTDPASSIARGINDLYYLILPISIVIGILVEALLIYALFRYRAKGARATDSGEHERGHTALEIAWTIPPALILLIVGLLSAQTLTAIENPPTPDFEVKVTGAQWLWTFEYPDGTTSTNELAVEAGKVVALKIYSSDVIHSFAVPALGVKIDAVPGRENSYWFRADEPGRFLMQCMEYCAGAHGYMRGTVVALEPGSTERGWRSADAGGITSCAEATDAAETRTFRLLESGGSPWSIDPRTMTVPGGAAVCYDVLNPAGQSAPHNITIVQGPRDAEAKAAGYDPILQPGRQGAFVATLEQGTYTYYCAVPGHRQLGMEGTLTVS